jgi:NADH-quinone oxidoreductase subunit G
MSDLVKVTIDGVDYEVEGGRNLLDVCLSLKLDLPYFCWHPALGSVGACRQCAVMQYWTDRRGGEHQEIVMACMTEAEEGTTIAIHHPDVQRFRARMIELLMTSHPHDCPVCDEGGECHLQDMTVMTGHTYRRHRFKKRTYRNQDLGPFLTHEMNRCITCYRCVRFYRDYAGGTDFGAFGIRNQVYFGRKDDGVLQSEFSGNLVEVCPTGVFDDKTLAARYTRKWDLQTAPSVCAHCGAGCAVIPGERYGELRRVLAKYNRHVNGHFICDRGRYGYEFVNAGRRLRAPLERDADGALRRIGVAAAAERLPRPPFLGQLDDPGPAWGGPPQQADGAAFGIIDEGAVDDLVARTAKLLGDGAIGIGSPRASLEDNLALRRLVGPERFYLGLSEQERTLGDLAVALLREGPSPSAELSDIQAADLVLVLGADLTNEAAILDLNVRTWLRLRPTSEEERLHITRWNDSAIGRLKEMQPSALWVAHTHATKLDDVAAGVVHAAPDDLTRFALALAHRVDAAQPAADGLPEPLAAMVETMGQALAAAAHPVILTGTGCGDEALLRAAARLAWSLRDGERRGAPLAVVQPEANTMGLLLLGGGRLADALYRMQVGEVGAAVVLQNDLVRRAPAGQARAALARCLNVIALDHVTTATTEAARVVLPAATWVEATGTAVSFEGRAQRFFRVFPPAEGVRPAWQWLRDLMVERSPDEAPAWRDVDDVAAELPVAAPALAAAAIVGPPPDYRIAGQKVARKPARYSGRTAMMAHLTIFEPEPPDDPDSPLAHSQEGYQGSAEDGLLVPRFWAPGWNSVNSLHKFQDEVNGPLLGGDIGVRIVEPRMEVDAPGAAEGAASQEAPRGAPQPGEWLVAPRSHLFGSGELSMLTPGIAGRAPEPYLALGEADAAALGLRDGDGVDVLLGGELRRLPLRLDVSLAAGVAGLPVGLPGLPGALPSTIRVAAPASAASAGAPPAPPAAPSPGGGDA